MKKFESKRITPRLKKYLWGDARLIVESYFIEYFKPDCAYLAKMKMNY